MAGAITFNLGPIAAPMAKARVGEPLLQPAVACEQQQPFAVGIQASGRIDPWDIDEISQASPAAARFRGELAQHPIGLVEEQGCQKPSSGFAGFPKVDRADGDEQQSQIHGNRGEDHGVNGLGVRSGDQRPDPIPRRAAIKVEAAIDPSERPAA